MHTVCSMLQRWRCRPTMAEKTQSEAFFPHSLTDDAVWNVKNCSHFMRGFVARRYLSKHRKKKLRKNRSRMPRTRSAHCRPNERWQNTRFRARRQIDGYVLEFGFFFYSNKSTLCAPKGKICYLSAAIDDAGPHWKCVALMVAYNVHRIRMGIVQCSNKRSE